MRNVQPRHLLLPALVLALIASLFLLPLTPLPAQDDDGATGAADGDGDTGEAADDSDKAKEVFPRFIASLREPDYQTLSTSLAPTAARLLTILCVQSLRQNPQLAVPINNLLTEHKATAFANAPGRVDAIAHMLANQQTELAGVKDVPGLLRKLLELGDKHQMRVMPAPADGIDFKSGAVEHRGEFAWAGVTVVVQGREQPGNPVLCRRVDGEWKLLSINPTFMSVAAAVHGHHIESAAGYDAMATKVTWQRLYALEAAIVSLPADSLPAAPADGSTAGLVAKMEAGGADANLPDGTIADGLLVDGWGRPLRFESADGIPVRLRSLGGDHASGTPDDLTTRDEPSAEAPANPRVELTTNKGTIVIELEEDAAPNSVANFINLVEAGFYDGTKFHRIVKGFMIQGGDPFSRTGQGMPGTGDAGYSLPDEYTPDLAFDKPGVLAYANSGPNTSSCQFFLTLEAAAHLSDRMQPNGRMIHYTILGVVVDGLDVVTTIGETPVGPSARGEMSVPKEDVTVTSAKVLRKRHHGYHVYKLPRGR